MSTQTGKSTKLKLIAAVAEDNTIALENGELPWVLPSDLGHFRKITTGNTIVMGWKTWESIGERALPNRMNLVLSRRKRILPRASNVRQLHNPMELYNLPSKWKIGDIYIIGGGKVYSTYIMAVEEMFITKVFMSFPGCKGCTKFPDVDFSKWKNINKLEGNLLVENNISFEYRHYVKS